MKKKELIAKVERLSEKHDKLVAVNTEMYKTLLLILGEDDRVVLENAVRSTIQSFGRK